MTKKPKILAFAGSLQKNSYNKLSFLNFEINSNSFDKIIYGKSVAKKRCTVR